MYKSRYRWHRSRDGSGVPIHTIIAEKALGKPLPKGCEVHHVDGDGHNNEPSNLVICPDSAYHKLLHRRTDALKACGNANWLKCVFCGEYDAPENMHLYVPKDQKTPRANHSKCATAYNRQRRKEG